MRETYGIYVILTEPAAGYRRAAEAAVAAGVRYLQLRAKGKNRQDALALAREIRQITRGSATRFIVNDDPELAAAAEADGVHLGQDDPGLKETRQRWGRPGKIYGLSTHNEAQAEAAVHSAPDYIGVGPVFATPTKLKPDPVLGPERAGAIIAGSPLTCVAIGGIDENTLPQVLAAGARNFACVRPVCADPDPASAIRRLMEIWQSCIEPD